jgi:hypothetical protein
MINRDVVNINNYIFIDYMITCSQINTRNSRQKSIWTTHNDWGATGQLLILVVVVKKRATADR